MTIMVNIEGKFRSAKGSGMDQEEATKQTTEAEVGSFADERDKFIRQCVDLYLSNQENIEGKQFHTARTPFADEATSVPCGAKDDLRGPMARDENDAAEPPLLAHRAAKPKAAEPKNERVAGRFLFGLVITICLIAPIDTSGITALPVPAQSAGPSTSAPTDVHPGAADAQRLIEIEPAGVSTPAAVHGGTVSNANLTPSPESIATLFEEFRQRYLPQAGGAIAPVPDKVRATSRSAPKPSVDRRVSAAAKTLVQRSRSMVAVATRVNRSHLPVDRYGTQEQPAAVVPTYRYSSPYPPAPSSFGFPFRGPIPAPWPGGVWLPRAAFVYPTPLQNAGAQSYDRPSQSVPLVGSYISWY